jgi:hypothetical protein
MPGGRHTRIDTSPRDRHLLIASVVCDFDNVTALGGLILLRVVTFFNF